MTSPRLLLTTDASMLEHRPGHAVRSEHPERPERLAALHRRLAAERSPSWRIADHAPAVEREVIERVHDPAHVDRVLAARGRDAIFDADTSASPGSVDAALAAVAHAVAGVRAVCDGSSIRRAFALVRPPGHHAEPDRAMGFCMFNNLAIAIEVARHELGVERVLVVDWDVHHGNGTQAAFWRRPDVLVFDVHQSPHYPGTGALTDTGSGKGSGYTVNLPVRAGLGDEDYVGLFEHLLVPIADAFAPELVVLAAGFDAHVADPLGDMRLSTQGYARLARIVDRIAQRHADGRILATLEGGYALDALVDSVWACAHVFADEGPAPAEDDVSPLPPRVAELVAAAARVHGHSWPVSTP